MRERESLKRPKPPVDKRVLLKTKADGDEKRRGASPQRGNYKESRMSTG